VGGTVTNHFARGIDGIGLPRFRDGLGLGAWRIITGFDGVTGADEVLRLRFRQFPLVVSGETITVGGNRPNEANPLLFDPESLGCHFELQK